MAVEFTLVSNQSQVVEIVRLNQGGAIRQKNSRQVISPRDTADISGLDQ